MSTHVYSDLELGVSNGVATITLNRIDAMNALNMSLKADLAAAVAEVAHNPEVRAVLITGNGKAFSAGGDIADMHKNVGAK